LARRSIRSSFFAFRYRDTDAANHKKFNRRMEIRRSLEKISPGLPFSCENNHSAHRFIRFSFFGFRYRGTVAASHKIQQEDGDQEVF